MATAPASRIHNPFEVDISPPDKGDFVSPLLSDLLDMFVYLLTPLTCVFNGHCGNRCGVQRPMVISPAVSHLDYRLPLM